MIDISEAIEEAKRKISAAPARKRLVKRAIFRANSGLHFLDECLTEIHTGATDAAYSRSCYILLSYNFELVLKAWLIFNRNGSTKHDLLEGLNSHDLEKLSKKVSEEVLLEIGIKKIQRKEDGGFIEYEVEMAEGRKIIIQDFVDVRYDFEKEILRNSDLEEAKRMREEVAVLQVIVKDVMAKNETQGKHSLAMSHFG